ncbi:hypothetical protein Q8F55_002994 [Vanrija albida]|uniref:Uncharacterized protein n=1 Tax=Vanrija albida TaxID=181172 RepID=A0ABR3QB89_9TREE
MSADSPSIHLPHPDSPAQRKIVIDGNGHAEVMHNILSFCDRRTLFVWRRVNHRFQYEADSILARHVIFTYLKPADGDPPNASMYGFVDSLGRFLPGSADAVIIIPDNRRPPSPQSFQEKGFGQLTHFGRHVQVLDFELSDEEFHGNHRPSTPFPRLQAVRAIRDRFPLKSQCFTEAQFSYRYNQGSIECPTAVVFGYIGPYDPFSYLSLGGKAAGPPNRDKPGKLVIHLLPHSLLEHVFAYTENTWQGWGAQKSLVIVLNALNHAESGLRIRLIYNTSIFIHIYFLLQWARTGGFFPTSITLVGLEEILSGYLPSDKAPPGIISKMMADDWDPGRVRYRGYDPAAVFAPAVSYLANLMETGQLTYISLRDYAATLTDHQRFIELVPSVVHKRNTSFRFSKYGESESDDDGYE